MNRFAVYLFICLAFSARAGAAGRKIAYERGENIFIADIDGSHARKIADGALPEISPDGTCVAFIGDLALGRAGKYRKRQTNKEVNGKSIHLDYSVLTLGNRAFLIRRFRFFPSVDIR